MSAPDAAAVSPPSVKSFLAQAGAALVVLAILVAVVLLARQARSSRHGIGAGAARQAQPARVVVHPVADEPFSDRVEAVGTLHAFESADISASVTEAIIELRFEDGQPVRAGDILALLDAGEEEAMLEAARAELSEQEREVRRLEDLVKQGAAPAVRLQERETLAEVARRRIDEINARVTDRRIVAPFDGIVGLRRISVGAMVSPGTVITTLDQIGRMKLDFTVPESFLADLRPGLSIAATSPAFPGRAFTGAVSQVDTRVDPVTRAVTVRAEIPNPERELRPGMLLTTVLERNPRVALAVPERAVIPLGRESFVFVVRREGESTVAERVRVEVGGRRPGWLEAAAGLSAGMEVITDGYIGLSSGSPVEISGRFEGAVPAYNPRNP